MTEIGVLLGNREPHTLTFASGQGEEVLRIQADGRVFWRGRELETDDQLRAAMLELRKMLVAKRETA